MEGFLRRRDLPSLFRSGALSDRTIALIKMEGEENAKLAAAATPYSPSSNSLWERRQELHHLARLTTVQICDIRKLWKSCNDDESPAHGVLARFGE
ncbi:unnamed protein product [Ilex paraguariensis]|uniref:Uncharacterized protein n=1 Tax=Ilex paraguariensis TaxID=185542 RepID=A0ABC8TW73_9AQUA